MMRHTTAEIGRRNFLGRLGGISAASVLLPGRTAGEEIGARPLRILFLTDVHATPSKTARAGLQATAERIRMESFDVIVGGGDFVHRGYLSTPGQMTESIDLLNEFLGQLGHPIRPVIGNHDLVGAAPADGSPPSDDPRAIFREIFKIEETFYSFDVAGRRFLVLDSVEILRESATYRGVVNRRQIDWLESILSATPPEMPLILCSHIPFYTTHQQVVRGPLAPLRPNLAVENSGEVLALFKRHRLHLVLQGHLHSNERIWWNDRGYLMGGAVCGAWWNGDHLGTPPGFAILELGAGGPTWAYLPISSAKPA